MLFRYTVHPKGVDPFQAAKAWHLRCHEGLPWKRVRMLGRTVSGAPPGQDALEDAVARAGLAISLEESLKAGDRTHVHVYIHMDQTYRRRGTPSDFTFEGIKPHVELNTASGGAYAGAVNHGHFYAFATKSGSLFHVAELRALQVLPGGGVVA